MVHLGKHGSMEWLPGKMVALSDGCGPDAAIGSMPLVYPFLVNDPGEGAQAKRRAHATIVDHLVPPMARAEAYGDIARLEQLMDEHANIAAMDPAKLPAIRAQIWTLIQAAQLDHDLGLDDRPHDAEFDDFLLHVDGWLCEIKDAQIRDGLHILGAARPVRRGPTWCWPSFARTRSGAARPTPCPGFARHSASRRAASTAPVRPTTPARDAVDAAEARARALVEAMESDGWQAASAGGVVEADPRSPRRRGRPRARPSPPSRSSRGWRAPPTS